MSHKGIPYFPSVPHIERDLAVVVHEELPILRPNEPLTPSKYKGVWMKPPPDATNCPPGLEYLVALDTLCVHQKVEMFEVVLGLETNNKYAITNSKSEMVYYAAEENDYSTRICCGTLRPFDIKVFDKIGNEMIHLKRPFACTSCCFPCRLQILEVSAPAGNTLGFVEQQWSLLQPTFLVKDAAGEVMMKITGPLFGLCGLCGLRGKFQILSKDGNEKLGSITKHWSGFIKELFTDADNFTVTFPMNMDVKMKAVILGACLLIDYMYFE